MKHNVLIIGPDLNVCKGIKYRLQGEYANAYYVQSCRQAVDYISRFQYTLVIMDYRCSESGGVEFVRRLRALDNAPILVLSSRPTKAEEIEVLQAGADTYLSMEESLDLEQCLAHAQAIMRRYMMNGNQNLSYILVSGNGLKINPRRRKAFANGVDIHLTPKQFALLTSLVEHMGEVVTKEQLYQDAWSLEYDINCDDALKYHISELRKKLGTYGLESMIETVWGVGYLLDTGDHE